MNIEQHPKNFRIRNILYFELVFQHKAPKLVQINFKITLGVQPTFTAPPGSCIFEGSNFFDVSFDGCGKLVVGG